MGIITKLEASSSEDRINIYIDEKFSMSVKDEIVYSLYIRKGQSIDEDRLKEIVEEENYMKAKSKALHILKFSSKSEKEIIDRLKKNEFEDKTIGRVLEFLKKYDFINDNRLAKNIIKSKVNSKKLGKNRVKRDLYKKGVSDKIIEEEMDETLDEEIEFENALELAYRKKSNLKDTDKRKLYEKIGRFLVYRGYDFEIVKRVLNKVLKNEEY
ncbi:MAG: recombination regulator RecX [Anaeromicrobium sp.]|jgi:regulatory protein|uniref:recombination regulator RecX n=1 Tax=Anaeromicrobium sp. TaxID=1929132 RepID=UPI0025E95B2B|nr:recombination regulator RecX [Anaeromicrobium sp.]MCT4595342.1 recombination regulator RecX [Anaeromicrobium sp.]